MNTNEIIKRFCENGYEAYLIGGTVRDMLLDIDCLDEDIVTNATPDQIEILFSDRKINQVGKSFNVTLIDGIDVATYRIDQYESGQCKSIIAESLYEDVSRRDLTINAMAFCPYTGELIDYFNGKDDLNNGTVKFVGNPDDRIKEDPVRMLRACRFVALLGNNNEISRLSPSTFKAIKENKHLISDVASERIRKEFLKVMKTCDEPSIFINHLYITGLLEIIIPELHDCYFFTGGNHHTEMIHEHLLATMDNIPKEEYMLRIVGLFHDIGKPVVYDEETKRFLKHEDVSADMSVEILKRLKFTNKEIELCYGIIKLHMLNLELNSKPKSIRKIMYRCIELKIDWKLLLLHKFSDNDANVRKDNWTEHEKNIFKSMFINQSDAALQISDLKINGKDILKLGITGKDIKNVLNHLLKSCISNPSLNDHDNLIKMTVGYLKQLNTIKQKELRRLKNE